MKVIIPCGAKKDRYPRPALDLYQGSYFLANRAYALSLVDDLSDVLILSAKYGLVPSHKVIAPYDVTFGHVDAVSDEVISAQVLELVELCGVDDGEVIVLGGRRYRERLTPYLPCARFLMEELQLGGMGYQIAWLYSHLGMLPHEPAR